MEPSLESCQNCDKATNCKFVIDRGQPPVDLLIVTDFQERPRSDYKKLIIQLLESEDIDLDRVFITGAIKHKVKNDAGVKEVTACREVVNKEVELYNPKAIVTMGNHGLKSILNKTGVTKVRGQVLDWGELSVIPTVNVAAILHNPDNVNLIAGDLRRAWEVANGNKPILPETSYGFITNIEEARALFEALNQQEIVAFDIETNDNYDEDNGPNPYKEDSRVIAISFSFSEGTGFCLPLWHTKTPMPFEDIAELETLLREFLANPDVKKIAHNGKFDRQYLKVTMGIEVANFYADTMLAHHLLNEEKGTHGLKRLAWQYTNMGGYDSQLDYHLDQLPSASKTLENVPIEVMAYYAAADTDVTLRLWPIFYREMKKLGLLDLFFGVTMKAEQTLLEMETNGVLVDVDYLTRLETEYAQKLQDKYEELRSYPEVLVVEGILTKKNNDGRKKPQPPVKFNFNSSKQVQYLLFDIMEMPSIKKTDAGKDSADDEVLTVLQDQHPLVTTLMEYRKLSKFYGTYIKPVRSWLDKDNLVHTSYLIHGTVTGRLSSQRPNMQNIPSTRSGELGKIIKRLFIPRPGNVIMQADYSQMEMRVLAMFCKDPELIKAFFSGIDLHVFAAMTVGGYTLEEVTKEIRQIYKTIQFGIVYCKGVMSLCTELGWWLRDRDGNIITYSKQEAEDMDRPEILGKPKPDIKRGKKVLEDYFTKFKGVKRWRYLQQEQAKSDKLVRSLFGRIRHLPAVDALDEGKQADALRQAVNAPIQSTASDITLISLHRIAEEIKKRGMNTLPIITVHDSMVFDVPEDEVMDMVEIIQHYANNPGYDWINVPIKVDIGIGLNYADLEDIE